MKTNNKRFLVLNRTDKIWAAPFAMTREEAEAFVKDFPERYQRQGHYRTASGKRIPPADVELELLRIEEE